MGFTALFTGISISRVRPDPKPPSGLEPGGWQKVDAEGSNRCGRMKPKNNSGHLSHEQRTGSHSDAGESHGDNSTAGTELSPRHRGESSETGAESKSQPKLGFMQARKAAKRARRQHSGHARAASPRRDPRRKAHSLIDKVYRWDTLCTAWSRVRANKGAHGLDRVTIRHFEAELETHLREIQRKLMERRYMPQPVRRVYIPKTSNPRERRPLGIPVVADRIVQRAILLVVEPIFDPEMSERSFGCRKGRKQHHAIAALIQDAKEGYRHVVDADVASFFDQISYDVVMSCVRRRIADGRVLDLIEAFLKAGVMEDGVVTVPAAGTPQGGVITPPTQLKTSPGAAGFCDQSFGVAPETGGEKSNDFGGNES